MAQKIQIRKFAELGGGNYGWLNTRHHFSFADYSDQKRVHWGALRVVNDDIIKPNGGFPLHQHKNMEIITYVLPSNHHPATNNREGGEKIAHRDSTGGAGFTAPGDVQVMSVGSDGISHSEFHGNANSSASVNLLQIWIIPCKQVKQSRWGTKRFASAQNHTEFTVFASGFANDKNALPINSPSRVVGVSLRDTKSIKYELGAHRLAYLIVTSGFCTVNGVALAAHDGAAIKETASLEFEGEGDVLMIDTVELNE